MKKTATESWLVVRLQMRAKAAAGKHTTGVAISGGVGVRWFPVSQRFAWFDETGPITKAWAVKKLEYKGKFFPK